MDKLLDFHLYFTAALQRTDMRAVGLQLAMDLIHRKVNKLLKLNKVDTNDEGHSSNKTDLNEEMFSLKYHINLLQVLRCVNDLFFSHKF